MTKYYLRLALFFTASGETAPARITAIATLANSCLLGFTLPANSQESVMDKFGQVFGAEELEAVSV